MIKTSIKLALFVNIVMDIFVIIIDIFIQLTCMIKIVATLYNLRVH
jgi:hypothetical protein